MSIIIKEDYKRKLTLKEQQKAIKIIKDTFEKKIAKILNLDRVTAPLILSVKEGINDNLSGKERSVKFDILNIPDYEGEIAQSLAKWKRMALYNYGYNVNEGIYTDMNAIRRDDDIDNIHSIYVDQWDWELIINNDNRNKDFLHDIINKIYKCIYDTNIYLKSIYLQLDLNLNEDIYFITTKELEILYPNITNKEREYLICKKYKVVFIEEIGNKLPISNIKYDNRSPDYDDWSLNGDLLIFNDILDLPLEITSMGIRVNANSLLEQLTISDNLDRLKYNYHKMIRNNELPLTIGGGIGQSRLCMLMLQSLHIGEVQCSIWPEEMINKFKKVECILL